MRDRGGKDLNARHQWIERLRFALARQILANDAVSGRRQKVP